MNINTIAQDVALKAQEHNCLYNYKLINAIFEEMAILLYKENKATLDRHFDRIQNNSIIPDNITSYKDNTVCWDKYGLQKNLGYIFYYKSIEKFRIIDLSSLSDIPEVPITTKISISLYKGQTTPQDAFELLASFFNLLKNCTLNNV